MTDALTITATAIGLLKNTTEALNALRERSQRSKDVDIKEQINTLYNNVLSLNELISRLIEENKDFRRQLEQQQNPPEKPKIKQQGMTNYYYVGAEGPYCQPCYDVDPKAKRLVALSPPKRDTLGGLHRDCPVCKQGFYETPNSDPEPGVHRGEKWDWS